ncbi:MAG: hypothetical protein COA67_08830, partial [Lutibacter sp.]
MKNKITTKNFGILNSINKIMKKSLLLFILASFSLVNAQTIESTYEKPLSPLELLQPIKIQTFEEGSLGPFTNGPLASIFSTNNDSPEAITTPTVPGQVEIDKTVEPVAGYTNLWEVTLRIEGMDGAINSDIVLTMDRSGSMNSDDRLVKAKVAAIEFVNTLLVTGSTTRIALVSFGGSSATVDETFLGVADKATLIIAINNLNASGQTPTQAGMRQAEALLSASTADLKSIVLLSDGVPTFSYALTASGYSPDDFLIPYPARGAQQTSALAPESAYNYSSNVGGNGTMWWRYENNSGSSNDKYYNHGNSARAEAGFAKNDGYVVYTIAFEAPQDGIDVLADMASPFKDYIATGATGELNAIFQVIAGSLLNAVQFASVSDPMGQGFTVLGTAQNIVATQGTVLYDSNNNTIDWDIGTLVQSIPLPGDQAVKFAELKYEIFITEDILTAPNVNGLYPTNGNATLSYTDINGNIIQPTPFPVPTVDPVIVTIEKTFLDSSGQIINDPDFIFSVGFSGMFNGDIELNSTDVLVIANEVSAAYMFTETGVTENGTPGLLSEYDITYEVDGVTGNTFQFFPNSPDQALMVTNKICTLNIDCPTTFTASAQCIAPDAATTQAELEALGVVFNSNCGTIVVSSNDVSNNNTCPEVITRTYTILDDLNGNGTQDTGENSTTCAQTITIDDTILPVLTGTAYTDATVYESCSTDAQATVPAWTAANAI